MNEGMKKERKKGGSARVKPFSDCYRVIGLTAIVQITCPESNYVQWAISVDMGNWNVVIHPIVLIIFYWYTVYQLKITFHETDHNGTDRNAEPREDHEEVP